MKTQFFKLKNEKPLAATFREWDEWKTRAKSEEPFKYWLVETVPDWFRDRWRDLTTPYNNLRYAIRCRIFDRYHIIKTGLKPGYSDCDTRMLHGMFNLLVDFVEVEKAWMHVVFDAEERKKRKHPWWSLGWTRFKAFRDPQAGLAHLTWEATLDNPTLDEYQRSDQQAVTAREVLELYNWWKEVRPTRLDPMDASGWSNWCDLRSSKHPNRHLLDIEDETEEESQESRRILNECTLIEKSYEDEDEAMLIRLVKIRKGLWT